MRQPGKGSRPVVLAGVKACDIASLVIQDHVFLKTDPEDPFYAANRSNTFIISSDCDSIKETCFCMAMDGAPYANTGFDINLSDIGDRFLVEVITGKGAELVSKFKMFFAAGTSRDAEKRESAREKSMSAVRGFIDKRRTPSTDGISGTVAGRYNETGMWQEFASTCVECGACNLVCPTCHCFLLFDDRDNVKSERYRISDSCLYNTFARVAGGANPRRHLWERLRNRFDKKFAFFPEVAGRVACTGCGRCIDACPGDIDIREVLKALVEGKWEKPPHC
jgi:ferredoxin